MHTSNVDTGMHSPTPPRYEPSRVLQISDLVRPFTVPQLKDLLSRTGTIVEGRFWTDKIKSRCLVEVRSV